MPALLCKQCEKKRAKRHCPGVGGEICPSCCGSERENTIDCPLECEFLMESRAHERHVPVEFENLPNADIRVDESFLREHEPLVLWLAFSLARAMEKERAVDTDAAEALEATIRTYRTLDSGLIYATRPQNPYAAGLLDAINKAVEEARERLAKPSGLVEQAGTHTLRDKEILGALVFLQRMELDYRNGRRRGRAFLQFLTTWFPMEKSTALAL